MSKTLGSIVTLIGAVVVNAFPLIGQVASAAILIGSAALGAVISSLDHGPRADQSQKPPQTETSTKFPTLSSFGEDANCLSAAAARPKQARVEADAFFEIDPDATVYH